MHGAHTHAPLALHASWVAMTTVHLHINMMPFVALLVPFRGSLWKGTVHLGNIPSSLVAFFYYQLWL